ncbi:interleukin-37 [Rhynchocyon petersi]
MSLLEKNSDVEMDSEDWGKGEAQGCSEGPNVTVIPEKFSICDEDHKVLVLNSGTLKAVPKKSHIHPEIFYVFASHMKAASKDKGSPIFLAVAEGKLFLCCESTRGKRQPTLQLKHEIFTSTPMSQKKTIKDLIAQKENVLPSFTFYKANVGSRYTLESAANPKWFLGTSSNPDQPVGVTNSPGKKMYTAFDFEQPHKVDTDPQ